MNETIPLPAVTTVTASRWDRTTVCHRIVVKDAVGRPGAVRFQSEHLGDSRDYAMSREAALRTFLDEHALRFVLCSDLEALS